jgi:hypothetical protein
MTDADPPLPYVGLLVYEGSFKSKGKKGINSPLRELFFYIFTPIYIYPTYIH